METPFSVTCATSSSFKNERGQINAQFMVHMISEQYTCSSDCPRQSNELDPLLYLAKSEAKVCREILHTGLVPKSVRDGKM